MEKWPAYFNDNIQKAARDITQNLTNLVKKMEQADKNRKEGENLSKVLEAWGDKGRKVPKGANGKEVKRELGAFLQAVKGAESWAKKTLGNPVIFRK